MKQDHRIATETVMAASPGVVILAKCTPAASSGVLIAIELPRGRSSVFPTDLRGAVSTRDHRLWKFDPSAPPLARGGDGPVPEPGAAVRLWPRSGESAPA